MANKNAKNVVNAPDVHVVAPSNMGKGLVYNETTKQYDVDVKAVTTMTTQKQDNGTGEVIGEQYRIDYGNGLVEVGGRFILTFPDVNITHETLDEFAETIPAPNKHFSTCMRAHYFDNDDFGSIGGIGGVGTHFGADIASKQLWHKESGLVFTLEDLGLRSILNINATAGDIVGVRTETAWVVQKSFEAEKIIIGIHTLALEHENKCPIFYSIKGIKA